MHYATLVTVEMEHGLEDKEREALAETLIEELEQQKKYSDHNIMLGIYQSQVRMRSTAFSNEMANKVDEIMEPYSSETDNPEYLEFLDMTEEYQKEYENDTVNLVRFPNGTILPETRYEVYRKYEIVDGRLYERSWGPLHHRKRTKQCKKMQVIKGVPYSDLYKTLGEYVDAEHGTPYFEEQKAFGYYYNPNAFYDWYSIGGRWPDMFLVKDDCPEYGIADQSNFSEHDIEVPDGYRWTCAARKKDIAWQAKHNWEMEQAKKCFAKLAQAFESGVLPEKMYGRITKDGILRYGDLIYQKGETEEGYLQRHTYLKPRKYPICVYGYLQEGEWSTADVFIQDGANSRYEEKSTWDEELEQFIDNLDDDTVLVGVDCHM